MLNGELQKLDFGSQLFQFPIFALEGVLHAQNHGLACALQVSLPFHKLIVLLQSMLRDLDVTFTLLLFVIVLGHEVLQLALHSLQPLVSLHGPLDECHLLLLEFASIEGVLGVRLLSEFVDERHVLIVELFPHAFNNLLHGHITLGLSLQQGFKVYHSLL